MRTDIIIRAFREQPDVWSSFQAAIDEQRERVLAKINAAESEKDLFRIQGELRGLTNIVHYFKTLLGNHHARADSRADAN